MPVSLIPGGSLKIWVTYERGRETLVSVIESFRMPQRQNLNRMNTCRGNFRYVWQKMIGIGIM